MTLDYFNIRTTIKPLMVVLAIVMLVVSTPFIGKLYEWNMAMKLPSSMKDIETFMRKAEDADASLTNAVFSDANIYGFYC